MKKIFIFFGLTVFWVVPMWGQGASVDKNLKSAFQLYQKKDYVHSAEQFSKVSRARAVTTVQKHQALYFLGLSLYRLRLRQMAAFPLIRLIQEGSPQYKQKSLDVLVAIADSLEEPSLLDYSLSKVRPEELSELAMGTVYFRLGEQALRNGELNKAVSWFNNSVNQKGELDEALYSLALTHLIQKEPLKAVAIFQQLIQKFEKKPITDRRRGMATLGLARALYQAKKWNDAAEVYRRVPKDHPFYRESLMELSWSLFRGGQFRSALSPLETLQTPFYSNFYDPESLLLHGIILLFSCHYDEVQPLISTFDKNYTPAIAKVQEWIQGVRSVQDYYNETSRAIKALNHLKRTGDLKTENQLPFFIVRTFLNENDIAVELRYLDLLTKEKALLQKTFTGNPVLLAYGAKIIEGRAKAARSRIALRLQAHLKAKVDEYAEFATHFEFLKYETLNGQRKRLKDQIAGAPATLDEKRSREFYIQNGYRFWPFQGEYWRDEVGSFQYVGVNSCEDIQ